MDAYQQIENSLKTEYLFIKNIKNKDDVVVNVLENKVTRERNLVKYFNGTAEVYRKLLNISHPNLPKVYNVVQADGKCIVIEEFIDGITVDETLQIDRYSSASVKKIIMQLCDVLSVIHRDGIVHRDIKPENIIVDNNGNIKLLDFNISRINKENQSKDTLMLGTTGFAAPEQYGISETDARSDIYSIGILINVMLTGEHPSKKLCEGKWRHIVNKCTRINPEERYNNVKELITDVNSKKLIVPIVMATIITLIVITTVMCSGRNKKQNIKPESSHTDLQAEATEATEEIETTTEEVTTETATTEEEITTEVAPTEEDITTEATSAEELTTTAVEPTTTEAPTEPPTEKTTTIEEPTTEESTVLNYTITRDDYIITVSGSGEITRKGASFTEPYITLYEQEDIRKAVFCEGITNIPSNAFSGWWQLNTITIPNTVTNIGSGAFAATGVAEIIVPSSVEYIGESALSSTNLWNVKLSEGLKTIDSDCFSGCSYLSSIVIPESVEYIGPRAFSGAGLRSIVLPSKLTHLEERTFVCCEYLKGIMLPEKLESIGDYCFAQCNSLESIIIPPSVTFIGEGALASNRNLVVYVTAGSYAEQYCIDNSLKYEYVDSVTLETFKADSVLDHLENSSFQNDITLEEVILHDNFTSFDNYCFYGCINLKRIVIPPSVTFIGENCFLGCDNLVIYLTPGSYAEQYCIDNNLYYEYVE